MKIERRGKQGTTGHTLAANAPFSTLPAPAHAAQALSSRMLTCRVGSQEGEPIAFAVDHSYYGTRHTKRDWEGATEHLA